MLIPNREFWVSWDKLFGGWTMFLDGSKMKTSMDAGVIIFGKNFRESYKLKLKEDMFLDDIWCRSVKSF